MKNRASLYTAFFVFFIDNFGFGLVYPLLGPLLLNPSYGILGSEISLNVKNLLLGILYAAYPLAQFFGAPLFGSLSDAWGRKKAFYYTIAGVMVGYFLSGIALLVKNYSFLFISRLFSGFFAGNMSLVFAAIADLSEDKERARNISLCTALGGIAWVLSMLTGGDLSNPQIERFFSPSFPFFLTAAVVAIGLIFVIIFYKETHASKETKVNIFEGMKHLRRAFQSEKLRFIFLAYLLWSLSWVMILSWFSTISVEKFHFSQSTISWFLVGNGVVWFLANLLSSTLLVKKIAIYKLAYVSFFFTGLSILLAAITKSYYFGVFFILASAFSAVAWSNTISLVSLNSSAESQGSNLGIGQSVTALGWIFGPLFASWISPLGTSYSYYLATLLLFLGTIILFFRGNSTFESHRP